jgi:hypothetical protein
MSGGCEDLRKRWDHLVGSSEKEAVNQIKQDGKKCIDRKVHRIFILFIK